ncbi:MAG: DUF1156 domain-containing protein, partial [Chloroflexi bacterium]|nr:DUF1156 domain-containing protein [Chloroflexota bacterium]
MGEQLYTVVYKHRVETRTKTGKTRVKWERGYRAPKTSDDNSKEINERLAEKLVEWEILDIVPTERFPEDANDDRPIQYGMPLWRNLFSPRQLLCHGTSVEIFRTLLREEEARGPLDEESKAAFVYLALALDKGLNYNSRMSVWMPTREVTANSFNRHDYAFCWSHGEMAPPTLALGNDWTLEQTEKCIRELAALVRPELNQSRGQPSEQQALDLDKPFNPPNVVVSYKS